LTLDTYTMASLKIRQSHIGLSTRGNGGTGSYLTGPGPMPAAPAIKAASYPAWHPKNPGNQVRVAVPGK